MRMAAIAGILPMHDERDTGLIRRLACQSTDHVVCVDDERICQTQATCARRHVHADCVAGDERCPEQSRRRDSVVEVVDLRAVQAREEVESDEGEAAFVLLAILPDVGSSHEPCVVGKGHAARSAAISDCACAVPRGEANAPFEVPDCRNLAAG